MAWIQTWRAGLAPREADVEAALERHRHDLPAAFEALEALGWTAAVRAALEGPLAGLLAGAVRAELDPRRLGTFLERFVRARPVGAPSERLAALLEVVFSYDALQPHERELMRAIQEAAGGAPLDLQEVAERARRDAFLYADTFDPARGEAGPWFARIGRREALRMVRRAARERDELARHGERVLRADPPTPLQEAGRREQGALLGRALAELSGEARRLVEALVARRAYAELARERGVSRGAIEKRILRLRVKLAPALARAGVELAVRRGVDA